ncbi:MAG: choice-of-anchor D domain-containing protein [Bryobacteraceae bacterium]
MIRALFLGLLAPALAVAQLQLLVIEDGAERTAPPSLDMGTVQAGAFRDARFRVRNTGAAGVTLNRLTVAGAGFRLEGEPTIPHVLASGNHVDFRVRFSPHAHGSYSANLTVNGLSTLLRGTSPAAATIAYEQDGKTIDANTAQAIDFGLAEPGTAKPLRFTLRNDTPIEVTVRTIEITGVFFRLVAGLSLPLRLEPRQHASFDIAFEPAAPGLAHAILRIDERSFWLEGTGTELPFPKPALVGESAQASGRQSSIAIRLAEDSPASGIGHLRMEFRPSTEGTADDSAIQFIATGRRVIEFHVEKGSREVRFGPDASALFQTGTTAGTLVFTAQLGRWSESLTVSLLPATTAVDSIRGWLRPSAVEIEIQGFDNTRTIGQLGFVFYRPDGTPLPQGSIRVDASNEFRKLFHGSPLGGLFHLRAVFPVSGSIADLGSIEVELTNSAGTARTQRVRF